MGSGIVFNTGGTLRIENLVSSGFNNAGSSGIDFNGAGTLEKNTTDLHTISGGTITTYTAK